MDGTLVLHDFSSIPYYNACASSCVDQRGRNISGNHSNCYRCPCCIYKLLLFGQILVQSFLPGWHSRTHLHRPELSANGWKFSMCKMHSLQTSLPGYRSGKRLLEGCDSSFSPDCLLQFSRHCAWLLQLLFPTGWRMGSLF